VYKQEGGDDARPLEKKEGFAVSGGTIGFLILAAAIIIFVVQNTNSVSVDFLFFNGEWPLWLVVVGVIAFTLLAERLGLWIWRRSRKREG
jgi:uncharacterized integral membrane protein